MQNKVILLIEDDYLDVESVKRFLKKLNIVYTLHVAHNGADALGMLTREDNKVRPDVILLDINMPKMNGLEFLGIIKNYYNFKNIRIFVITTSTEEYDKLSTQNLGVVGYIVKPLNLTDKPSEGVLKLKTELLDESYPVE